MHLDIVCKNENKELAQDQTNDFYLMFLEEFIKAGRDVHLTCHKNDIIILLMTNIRGWNINNIRIAHYMTFCLEDTSVFVMKVTMEYSVTSRCVPRVVVWIMASAG